MNYDEWKLEASPLGDDKIELVSNCCGALPKSTLGYSDSMAGICSACKEHCEYVETE